MTFIMAMVMIMMMTIMTTCCGNVQKPKWIHFISLWWSKEEFRLVECFQRLKFHSFFHWQIQNPQLLDTWPVSALDIFFAWNIPSGYRLTAAPPSKKLRDSNPAGRSQLDIKNVGVASSVHPDPYKWDGYTHTHIINLRSSVALVNHGQWIAYQSQIGHFDTCTYCFVI